VNEALFHTHLTSEDLDWLPRRFAAIRWTVTGGVWTGFAAVSAAIMWGSYDPLVLKILPFMAGGAYLAGDWLARSVLRSRLRKLAHGAVDLTRLPAEPDGELVHVVGRVQVRKPLAPFIDTRRATYRRVVYRVGRYRLVHEAAEHFWLTTDDGEPVLVEVERARLLALDNALTEYPGHDPIAMLLAMLPLPEGYEPATQRSGERFEWNSTESRAR